MKPVEGVLAVLGSLNDKDREQVRRALLVLEDPCAKKGHNFKAVKVPSGSIWTPDKTQMVCTKCGAIRVIQ
jgi:hypothetical protein